ncbi:SPFH domain/Band 7 family protein [Metarhizium robertsii]|uniref:SPFH domain/Band 7 family protein n=2 Tax=Metarhizium robertsii TaxID=568076 RepID=E9FAS8_METRA|nr:SPFH domain/Band 7 family protein [Metarhizium robertsii ARSEF 23]EFY95172.1 SPFH domain/Band 7 family protein [Metarhizium robertsii ARSEF 23]EXU96759.1 SPFH domain/Band 7 family protein [Metarhizium robertsii]
MLRYKVSGPDEYLAITGWRVRTVKITKSSLVWPFQRYTRFSVQPHDYAMDLQAMTKEKLQFSLPVVFTVGPDVNARGANSSSEAEAANEGTAGREDNGDALMKYAMLLAGSDDKKTDARAHVASIVKGIIEGETRVLVSSMTMEEIFTEREMFKKRIFRNIQGELDQFGQASSSPSFFLHCQSLTNPFFYSVKELKDAPGSVYFASLSRKAHEGATNQARIDVAEAQLRGNVGEAKRKGEQEREIAKIQADTAVQKTERDIERAAAEARLMTQQTHLTRDVDVTRVEAQRALESKDEDLKKQVEIKRAAAEMERLRAKDVVQATIARESKQQAADAAAYEVTANARANQEANQRLADADAYKTRVGAEAENYAAQQSADASAFRQVKEAEGISAMADAYTKLAGAFGGPAGLLQYMMIEKGTYVELAKANAEAIRGLQPKISVWNTGASGAGEAGSSDPTAAMRNVYQMLPPLMTTINEQTGITLPEWQFGKLNAGVQAMNQSNVNGHKTAN